ncbi:MAG: hypothetical protein EP329_02700, partial [Deltaproteobacteria bacterium]
MRAALALVLVLVGCGGDPQADVALLCGAAETACPSEGCGNVEDVAERWSRALGRLTMGSDAGREVRAAAYAADPGDVDAAV